MSANGTAVAGHDTVKASMSEEMAAIDKLGPLTRAALNNSSFKWSAIATLKQFQRRQLDPLDPLHDMLIADELTAIDRRKGLT